MRFKMYFIPSSLAEFPKDCREVEVRIGTFFGSLIHFEVSSLWSLPYPFSGLIWSQCSPPRVVQCLQNRGNVIHTATWYQIGSPDSAQIPLNPYCRNAYLAPWNSVGLLISFIGSLANLWPEGQIWYNTRILHIRSSAYCCAALLPICVPDLCRVTLYAVAFGQKFPGNCICLEIWVQSLLGQ